MTAFAVILEPQDLREKVSKEVLEWQGNYDK